MSTPIIITTPRQRILGLASSGLFLLLAIDLLSMPDFESSFFGDHYWLFIGALFAAALAGVPCALHYSAHRLLSTVFLALLPFAAWFSRDGLLVPILCFLAMTLLYLEDRLRIHPIFRALLATFTLLILGLVPSFISGFGFRHLILHLGLAVALPLFAVALASGFLPRLFSRGRASISMRTAGLSDRERQFSTMLLAGNTHREIATANKVAESTVKATLSNSYRKLGVSSANELRRLEADFKIVD